MITSARGGFHQKRGIEAAARNKQRVILDFKSKRPTMPTSNSLSDTLTPPAVAVVAPSNRANALVSMPSGIRRTAAAVRPEKRLVVSRAVEC